MAAAIRRFGSAAFDAIYADGQGALVQTLAERVRAAGVRRVTGHVIADESLFDSERGPVAERRRCPTSTTSAAS